MVDPEASAQFQNKLAEIAAKIQSVPFSEVGLRDIFLSDTQVPNLLGMGGPKVTWTPYAKVEEIRKSNHLINAVPISAGGGKACYFSATHTVKKLSKEEIAAVL